MSSKVVYDTLLCNRSIYFFPDKVVQYKKVMNLDSDNISDSESENLLNFISKENKTNKKRFENWINEIIALG